MKLHHLRRMYRWHVAHSYPLMVAFNWAAISGYAALLLLAVLR
jgi:hypothetical protein